MKDSVGFKVVLFAYLHFVHLYVLLILGKLEVGVVGCWSELVARQHEEDQSRHLHQKLRKHESVCSKLTCSSTVASN